MSAIEPWLDAWRKSRPAKRVEKNFATVLFPKSVTLGHLPIKRRIRNDAARLVAKLAKAFSFRAGSAERPGNPLQEVFRREEQARAAA
jgi:hypothetical protein